MKEESVVAVHLKLNQRFNEQNKTQKYNLDTSDDDNFYPTNLVITLL